MVAAFPARLFAAKERRDHKEKLRVLCALCVFGRLVTVAAATDRKDF
jgi:hypothetical protein